jgi:SAM-dependent methyltransferase
MAAHKPQGSPLDQMMRAGYECRAALYHLECGGTEDHAFLARLVGPHVRALLEIPAGSGRNLAVWRQYPRIKVIVADLEPAMVQHLRERIALDCDSEHVSAVQVDMTTLALPETFDLIVVPQEGFQVVARPENVVQVLERLRTHLSDTGLLMIDIAMLDPRAGPPFPEYYDPGLPDGVEIMEWSRSLEDGRTLRRSRTQSHEGSQVHFHLHYSLGGAHIPVRAWSSRMTLQNFPVAEFVSAADAAGLRVSNVYSNYECQPYDGRTSRTVFLLTKNHQTSLGPATGPIARPDATQDTISCGGVI